jgi:uncharacterized protein
MKPHVAVITLGVKDLERARRFYDEGLGWPIQQEDYNWVCFLLGDGSSALALYPWDELANDANVPADGTGFRGITLAHNVRSRERVDEVLAGTRDAVGRLRGLLRRPRGLSMGGGYGSDAVTHLRVTRTYVRNILGPLQTSCKARRTLLSSPST